MAGQRTHDLAMARIRGTVPRAIAARGRTPPATGAVIARRRGCDAPAAAPRTPRAWAGIREARQPS